jgi:hypothetical protein
MAVAVPQGRPVAHELGRSTAGRPTPWWVLGASALLLALGLGRKPGSPPRAAHPYGGGRMIGRPEGRPFMIISSDASEPSEHLT